jgi:two-component system cell cycle response regulator DivK
MYLKADPPFVPFPLLKLIHNGLPLQPWQGRGEKFLSRRDNSCSLILVVDDNENNREVLNLFLSGSGYRVVEARNGLHAVAVAINTCPNLILMDLSMPVMDGFSAVRLIREIAEISEIPIVACTANDSHRLAALAAGFNGFLTKPLDFAVLDKHCVNC